jgi:energy-converting hydrogenase Eha subunit G
MKKAPLKKVLEKTSDTMIDLGKAAIIAGFASFFIKPVNWVYAVGGITLGLLLIAGGLRITYYAETIGDDNA